LERGISYIHLPSLRTSSGYRRSFTTVRPDLHEIP
jgi:hypothetical protein